MPGYTRKKQNRGRDVIGSHAQAEREDMWGEMPGRIVSFDAGAQTATIQPLYKKRLNGEPTALPQLLEVPVRFPRVGGFVVTAPVKNGDLVALRPQMRNTENYHDGGGEYAAADTRSASLSDYEAFLDGGEPLSQPISSFNGSNFEIRSEDGQFKIEFSEAGKFRLQGAQGNAFTLTRDIAARAQELCGLLATEPQLVHVAEYAALATQFQQIADKLTGMAL
jgi:hypothetical protein